MRTLSILIILCLNTAILFGQEKKELYDPAIDGIKQLGEAVTMAATENKHVLVQVGGNWCPWCIRFNKFCTETPTIDSILKANYVVIHLNYSKENKNLPALEKLGYPQRFGFPVLVVLNGKGERLHTQDSGLLEKEKSYDINKVMTFLGNWNPAAIDPDIYKPIEDSDVNNK